jgi:uncharacterized protein YigA (DUF484 family)
MSKQPSRGVTSESLPEENIVDYLQRNPDFFERHTGVLTRLRLPHTRGPGSTVSLIERQVRVLREKNEALEQQLQELIDISHSNSTLAENIHKLTCRLLRADTATAVITGLESSLTQEFRASHWLLLLTQPVTGAWAQLQHTHLRLAERSAPELKMLDNFFESGTPRCGQIRDKLREYLFGAEAPVQSAALVNLGSKTSGLLAVGSAEPTYFHPGLSTDFLSRIGEIVGEAIGATR